MSNDNPPSLENIPVEVRIKIYQYIFSDLYFTCNWDMQPQHCDSCSLTHDVINVLRLALPEGHDLHDRHQYSLAAVSTKLRSEIIPLIRKSECQIHVLGPTLVIGAPHGCRGLFDFPSRLVPTQHLRSLVLDQSLPQLPRFSQLPNLKAVILPAPSHCAHELSIPLPAKQNRDEIIQDAAFKKSFMYKLGQFDFGTWCHRLWHTIQQESTTKKISLCIRRTVYVAGTDHNVDMRVDMEMVSLFQKHDNRPCGMSGRCKNRFGLCRPPGYVVLCSDKLSVQG